MTSHRINTTGVNSVAGIAYPFAAPDLIPVLFYMVRVAQSLVACVVGHCLSSCPFFVW